VLVFPITTAPACLSRATCGASKSGTYEAKQRRAEGRPDARRLGQILHRDGQAVQRPGERAAGGLRVEPAGRDGRPCSAASVTIALTAGLASVILPAGAEQFGGGEFPWP